MIKTVEIGSRSGSIAAPASKSIAHRMLICATLSAKKIQITCRGISKDIAATMDCLKEMGADIRLSGDQISFEGMKLPDPGQEIELHCKESGSTLRFLLPIMGALGLSGVFVMEGRLPERPMEVYEKTLEEHGMHFSREGNRLHCSGSLQPGVYCLPGNISSQYFTGLLFALPLLKAESTLFWEGVLESRDYVDLTETALRESGIHWQEEENGYRIFGMQSYDPPSQWTVEGDYSGAAFFLCAGAFSKEGICVSNLRADSQQGDRRVLDLLCSFGAEVIQQDNAVTVKKGSLKGLCIDASMIPDLIPVLCVVASYAEGESRVINGQRLRMKESDRISSTVDLLLRIGADVKETADGMIIQGSKLHPGGAQIDPVGDHRLAMSAAVSAAGCRQPLTIQNASCVEKSYVDFWEDFQSLKLED